MAVRQNLANATTSPERGLGRSDDRRGNFKKPTSQRSDNNRDTSSRYGNNGERQQSQNYRSDDGQQRNRSSNQNRPDYSDNGYSNRNRNQSRNNSDYDNRQYNNNSTSNSNFNFQNDQGYNSHGDQNYEGFNQDSSYRSQNNDRDVEESSSPSSNISNFRFVCCSKPPLCKARAYTPTSLAPHRAAVPTQANSGIVVSYCTYMHPYVYTVSRTYVYNTSGPWNLMLSGHANDQFCVLHLYQYHEHHLRS